MRSLTALLLLGIAACGARAVRGPAGTEGRTLTGEVMPEFTQGTWLEGSPQRLSTLKGKVVLVDFWTFG